MQGRFKRDGSAAAEPEPHGPVAAGGPGAPADAPNGGEPAERPKAKGPSGPGSRIALRNWRISTRLVSLLALPVVAATTLGAMRIDTSLKNVDQLDHMKLLTDMTSAATQLANALQEERDKSAGPLIKKDDKNDAVVSSRQRTDREIQEFKDLTKRVQPDDKTMVGVGTTLVDISKQLDAIKEARNDAYRNPESISRTIDSYDALVNSLLALSQDMAQASSNSEMISATRALATFSSAKEYASMQRALISAALARPTPELSPNDRLFGQAVFGKESQAMKRFINIHGDGDPELLQSLNGGNYEMSQANTYAERVLIKGDGLKSGDTVSYQDWYDRDSTKIQEMIKIEDTLLSDMQQKALELREDAQQEAYLNGALIILVLGISLVGAFVVARSMVRSLRRLQDTAQKVAQDRLPELVKQLSESDPQDVDTSVESVGVHSRDEIGQVAAAFDDVHREAVRLAAEQALLRGNVNAMFTNLSRRSQGLIQRQLSLISELESREADPDQLSSLFKLDHLATRMRRNGENLLVLAGEEPGRRWTRPVPLVDVLRAAASEVEQYERIELTGVPPTEVAGRVVNDLVHLLAELLENATSFSSPQTKVKVTGHALPDGRVLVEIHDTGIGLSQEDLAAINERLASPPTVDVSVSRRMGLFVVGRLSLRHGIRIQLRPSDSGGTTALVMLPVDVAQGGKKPAPGAPAGTPGIPGGGMPPGLPGTGTPGGGKGMPGLPGGPGGAPQQADRTRQQLPPKGPRPPAAPSRTGGLTGSGLPTRVPGSTPGAGAPTGGPSLFDASPPSDFPSGGKGAPAADGRPGLPPRGKRPAVIAPVGNGRRPQLPKRDGGGPADLPVRGGKGNDLPARGGDGNGLPTRGGDRNELPTRGGDGNGLPTRGGDGNGLPTRGGGAPSGLPTRGSGPADLPVRGGKGNDLPARGGGNDLPTRGGGGTERPTGEPSARPAPSWGNDRSPAPAAPADDWPLASDGSSRAAQDTPRGHDSADSAESTAAFPALDRSGNPSATGQFPQLTPVPEPESSSTGRHALPAAPGDTGQFARPRTDGAADGPGTTGQFPRLAPVPEPESSSTGRHALPAVPAAGDPADTAAFPHLAPVPEPEGDAAGRIVPPGGTGRFGQRDAGQETTPLFQELESHWFRDQEEARDRAAEPAAEAPRDLPRREPRGTLRPEAAAPSAPTAPEAPEAPLSTAQTPLPDWRESPNDERWRRAEQVREPAAGGTTSSGLPRRVPRANLVEGTAQQQSLPAGPQVSRAPQDVRGRLTNLRRGIQQGRQAGTSSATGSHNVGPTYQQER
ncbi:nitrate- and nitrite sensing domain-containing protein [Streptomyces sp. I05A-00742]|uniref:sensor histidine kinase n=1 Tax=Streptomyces sp. I05A-00742 TaxID=2732853 RepID=UPI0014892948|nr:nitrate- and nitrite sensing domain-containing protein [Streptomyces sp. I05A-00742]